MIKEIADKELLLSKLSSLQEKIWSNDEMQVFHAAGDLRFLLLDHHKLLDEISEKLEITLTFQLSKYDPSELKNILGDAPLLHIMEIGAHQL